MKEQGQAPGRTARDELKRLRTFMGLPDDGSLPAALGVGSGGGNLYVYGLYEAIKVCQDKLLNNDNLEHQLAEALRLGKVGFHQMKVLWMHDKMLVRHWHQAYVKAQGKLDAVRGVEQRLRAVGGRYGWIHRADPSFIARILDRILKEGE